MTNAIDEHHAAFAPPREAIARNDMARQALSTGLKLQAEANEAAERNAMAANAGLDTTQTLTELKAALQALLEFDGGYLATIFFYLTGPSEDIHRDANRNH
ncbi:MAG: hypothetical protein C5B56_05270 [Proteobacteria bacterium]|nr:MAG: hypothetical protein C5B56_05270 [Pseudomonadota bacterium]